MLVMQFKPHCDSLDYRMYISGCGIISASMFIALCLRVNVSNEDAYSQQVFSGLLIAMHVGMVLTVFTQIGMVGHKGWLERNTALFSSFVTKSASDVTQSHTGTVVGLKEHSEPKNDGAQQSVTSSDSQRSDLEAEFDLWKKTGFDAC